ncbi:RidA family protein [Carboxylicivirga sp. A043]|uniref:RidA family protein n=1 Tax=Carboxylicivirga litoralis TaxID=2816963 RepID=UPI0021CB1ADF|nr:RidA family protein [Carboxylicivirga sp. A043]MCU4157750.1 RidA family protein [Carboxylicivirga sp. A043]
MSTITVQPIPQGKYLPAVRHKDVVYTSGMTPRKAGKLKFIGQIKADKPIDRYKEAVQLATSNAIAAAESCLNEGERLSVILRLNVYLNAERDFLYHAIVADYATDALIEKFGVKCIGSRIAIGVSSLPSNAMVEISLIATVS